MAEPEVATKAPESDAMADQAQVPATTSLLSGDTPAQTGASLGVRGSSSGTFQSLTSSGTLYDG